MSATDLKPWFREDIARALVSIYFTSKMSDVTGGKNKDYRSGFASALSSVAIMVGINPGEVLAPEDIALLRECADTQ